LNISNFHNSKNKTKKHHFYQQQTLFSNAKKKIRQIKTKTIFAPRQVITE